MRDKIRREVSSIIPISDREAATIAEVISWIDSGAELYRRQKPDIPNKHLISYFAVVDGDYVLLVDHKNAELWLPTGGHVEVGEHPIATVIREAKEELSIEAEFLQQQPLLVSCTNTVGKTAGHTDVSIWYALKGNRKIFLDFDKSEFHSVRWFHKNDIPFDRTDPELKHFLNKLYRKDYVS